MGGLVCIFWEERLEFISLLSSPATQLVTKTFFFPTVFFQPFFSGKVKWWEAGDADNLTMSVKSVRLWASASDTAALKGWPCSIWQKRQIVMRGLTEVKFVEARPKKYSAGAQIIFNQTILWGSAISQLKTKLEFERTSFGHPRKDNCYQTPLRKLICTCVKKPDL